MESATGKIAFIKENIVIDCKSEEEALRLLSILEGQEFEYIRVMRVVEKNLIEFKQNLGIGVFGGSYKLNADIRKVPCYELIDVPIKESFNYCWSNYYFEFIKSFSNMIIAMDRSLLVKEDHRIIPFAEFKIAYDYFYRNV